MTPVLSVIVPCYNSERTIRPCLQALLAQQTGVEFEIVVVDSSADGTARIVETEFRSVRLIKLPERTFAGSARNIGIAATQAPYCLMIDSDCVAAPDLIDRAMARHREDQYAAVGGSLANGTPGSISGTIGYLIEFKEFMPTAHLRLVTSVPTANVVYRREALERYGGFDKEMRLAEDIFLHWQMFQAGDRILFDPELRVTHLNKTGWRQILKYQLELGQFSALARQRCNLPGGILLRHPVLVLLMPFARLFRAFEWFGKNDRKVLAWFLLIWPAYFVAAIFWSAGFFTQCRKDFLATRPGNVTK